MPNEEALVAETKTAPVAPEVEHLRGCPAPEGRIESYEVKNPAGELLTVTRCLECAGHTIRPIERT